jgi:hypothetical protein
VKTEKFRKIGLITIVVVVDVELTSVYAFQCIDDHKIVADIEFLCKTFNTTSLEEACMKALGIHDTR